METKDNNIMTNIELYRDQANTLKMSICDDMREIFRKHNATETAFIGETCINGCIILNGYDDSIFTLDRIEMNEKGDIYMEASSSWRNDTFCADDVSIDTLIDVLELLIDGEDELFCEDDCGE